MKKERKWVKEQSDGELAVTAVKETVNSSEGTMVKSALTVARLVQ